MALRNALPAGQRALSYANPSVRDLDNVKRRMRQDWDWRARQDASFFVAFGRRRQSREEFLSSAGPVLHTLREELRRFPPDTDFRQLNALEIGCGPGRLMLPLSEVFGRIVGVDVSGEMVALARQNLAGISNAQVHRNDGAALAGIADESVDFCYSYAVFQHIPGKQIIWNYLREASRVLRAGGILKCQFNSLLQGRTGDQPPPLAGWSLRAGALAAPARIWSPDTWSGVSFCAEEIAAFVATNGLPLLALDRFDTQYLWVTARKPGGQSGRTTASSADAEIVRVTDTFTADAVVAQSGRFASATVWVLDLPEDADLNSLRVLIDGRPAAPCFIGKHVWKNPTQVNVYLPPGVRTGVVPVWLEQRGSPISNVAPMRVVPPGPPVPRIVSVTDAVNLLSNISIEHCALKMQMEEVDMERPDQVGSALRAEIDGIPISDIEVFCLDPLTRLYEADLSIPQEMAPGPHRLTLWLGRRQFPDLSIEVASTTVSP